MGFIRSIDKTFDEVNGRKGMRDGVLSFGVQYLDDAMLGILKNDLILVGAASGGGKCLGRDTPVLMFDGSVKVVQDIQVGDVLMGPDSGPRNVIKLGKGIGPLFRIKPIKGESWVCNDAHILSIRESSTKKIKNIDVISYLATNANFKMKHKQWRCGVEFNSSKELPIDPYFLGLWIGDGSFQDTRISNPDIEIHEYLENLARKLGMNLSKYFYKGKCPSLALTSGYNSSNKVKDILDQVGKNNGEKRISNDYLTSTRDNRLKLLAGIIDTDGYLGHNSYEITLKEKNLSDQVLFLARSLGFAAYQAKKIGKIKSIGFEGIYYRINISGHVNEIPVLVERKKASPRRQIKDVLNVGFDVEAIGEGEYFGFEIDGDRLFMLGDFTVTHNTQFCCNVALANVAKGKKVHYIALEAEDLEIERRIKYQLFARSFFSDPNRPKIPISFQQWMVGDFLELCVEHEAIAAKEFMEKVPTLFTFYKSDKFDIDDLTKTVLSCADETDLIILDHVHYMDLDDNNENRAIKAIAKNARSLALEMGKPIILVSHVRKTDKSGNTFTPSLEDFHGSSDLYKIATKAITLGAGPMSGPTIETYMRIVKNRFEGSVTRYIAKCFYNSSTGKYERSYEVGDAYQDRSTGFHQLEPSDYPAWAEYSTRKPSQSVNNLNGESKPPTIKRRARPFSVGKKND